MTVLTVTQHERTRLLTLDRPQAMNALSSELARALLAAVQEADRNPSVRAIVITGAGGRAFSAGADLKERRTLSADDKWAQSRTLWAINEAVWRSPKAVIA